MCNAQDLAVVKELEEAPLQLSEELPSFPLQTAFTVMALPFDCLNRFRPEEPIPSQILSYFNSKVTHLIMDAF